MSNGINGQNNMQPLFYDKTKNQYVVGTPQGQGLGGQQTYSYSPFEGGNGLPNLNPTYKQPPPVNYQPTQALQNQLANAQAMFNSPLAIPQTRTAPKPSIGGKK